MIPYNGFILSIVMMLLGAATSPIRDEACTPMEATIKVVATGDGQGAIEILIPRDANIKVYLLSPESGEPPVEKTLTNGQLRNVAAGQYDVILQDTGKKYCIHLQRVTVN